MDNFKRIGPRQLTEIEWNALRAALRCGCGGLPLVPGLLEKLSEMSLVYYEIFVLKPICTRDADSTYYVLLGWPHDHTAVPPSPFPRIFGIYAAENYRYRELSPDSDALPSFDELYRAGLDALRRENQRNIRKGIVEGMALGFVAGCCLAIPAIQTMMHLNIVLLLEIIAPAIVFGGSLGGLLNRRKHPKSDATPVVA
jgi:hypothetical protein